MSTTNTIEDAPSNVSTKKWWPWVLASPVLIVAADYLAVAPVGSDFFLLLTLPISLGVLAAMLVCVLLPFMLLSRTRRKTALAWWFISICFVALSVTGFIVGRKIRTSAFHDLAERSSSLVAAVTNFTEDHESPPSSLDALVPDYLAEIPKTGMMAYPDYHYQIVEKAEQYEGNPWILRISTPTGGINFDEFMYFPLQNYPKLGYGGSFQRIGKWAYLHE